MPVPPQDYERIAARRRDGESSAQLAAEYGVTPVRINQIVRQEAARAQGPEAVAALAARSLRRRCQRPGCGRPARRAFCSNACAGLAKRQRTEQPCARPGCPNVLVLTPSEVGERKYCSLACTAAVFAERGSERRTCARPGCAETFVVWRSAARRF